MEDEISHIFEDRNIPFKYETIRTAITEPGTGSWVSEHLRNDTLLSKDEITIYTKLGSSASVYQQEELQSTRPILDDELKRAIELLNTSTAAIDRQTEALKFQCKELRSQIDQGTRVEQQRSKSTARLSTGHTAETQRINLAIDDMIHDFEEMLQTTQKELSTDQNSLLSNVSSLLREHDAILRNMENMAAESQSEEDSNLLRKRAASLSTLLARYLSEEIKCRLDRVFLETMEKNELVNCDEHHVFDQAESVEAEISSLYPEITVLSDMAARKQFRSPVLNALEEWRSQSRLQVEEQLQQIHEMICELTESTIHITEKVKCRQNHNFTLISLTSTYHEQVSNRQLQDPKSENKRLSRYTPRLSQAYAGSRGSLEVNSDNSIQETSKKESTQSLENLLRRFGASLSSLQNADSTEAVHQILNEKRLYILEMLERLYDTITAPLAPNLDAADKARQLLSAAVQYGANSTGPLGNTAQQQRTEELQAKIAIIQKGVEGIGSESLYSSGRTRERFLETWG
ncbi:Vacuolar cation/proton exchanger 5 [Ophidiomyces ophidiicola]|uniref:Vacuolar cation/proton exchanger 5 n=1 Tax=Ophidiomyces ophidiicola TaxID=1387563 RepID=UPI0020C59B09|nr:Vacuolar cation/proton exchanger 5 [Ophidiomyces ophidiicola]KAI1938304.1 Vacuolar cation/proton exchanger 5 [Ophidiomyces ophidiicola]KAI2016246.1 Vacuolar cation/proton exchanger 5 [Ophidiomyces ophidiicola]KAI2051220.1 Vacuolar cation/proton exchanger 5 [Ophidiomyces ophidiicola]KAI2142056.1 Vacuolar cation/proton exchanger 5 [Ophidiomyces ophidiicola]KAI2144620.1 Vacuolar cation/proton exchanger 5 [Ophidiomyces ophidiicola]